MKTFQDNSCKCQTITEDSDMTCSESSSSVNNEEYACNKFSDPDWIKDNCPILHWCKVINSKI